MNRVEKQMNRSERELSVDEMLGERSKTRAIKHMTQIYCCRQGWRGPG